MNSVRDKTQVFIIRIWCEPREIEGAPAEWRGVIEHVASGKRHYLKNLSEILEFIRPYMAAMGIKLSLFARFKQWFKRIRSQP